MVPHRRRLLVDGTPLSAGGGVQVAIAFLDHLIRSSEAPDRAFDWSAVLPDRLRDALPRAMADDPRLCFLPKRTKTDIVRIARALPRLTRQFAPSVVFTVFGPAYFKARVPHVVGFALGNLIYPPDGPFAQAASPFAPLHDCLKRHLVRRADHHITETETVRRRLCETLGIDRRRISVIANSVNPLLAAHPPAPVPSTGLFAILVPSAYYRHKNLEIIPDIAHHLEQLLPGTGFEFRLTLPEGSAPLAAIQAAAHARGVGARLRTLGVLRLDALALAYQEAAAVMLPTLRESSTAVYPEAFHFERPLVTSDMDFARELCADAALFADPLSATDFADKLASLIRSRQNGGTLTAELVAAGRRQLAAAYPTPKEKFERQLELLSAISKDRSWFRPTSVQTGG